MIVIITHLSDSEQMTVGNLLDCLWRQLSERRRVWLSRSTCDLFEIHATQLTIFAYKETSNNINERTLFISTMSGKRSWKIFRKWRSSTSIYCNPYCILFASNVGSLIPSGPQFNVWYLQSWWPGWDHWRHRFGRLSLFQEWHEACVSLGSRETTNRDPLRHPEEQTTNKNKWHCQNRWKFVAEECQGIPSIMTVPGVF